MLSMINYGLTQSNQYYPVMDPQSYIRRKIGIDYLTQKMVSEIKALKENLFGPLPIFGIFNVQRGWAEIAEAKLDDVIDLLFVCRSLLSKNDSNFPGLLNFSRLWNAHCSDIPQIYITKYGYDKSTLLTNCTMYHYDKVLLINPKNEELIIYNNLADYPKKGNNVIILNWDFDYLHVMIHKNTLLSIILMCVQWINIRKEGFQFLLIPSLYGEQFNGILTRDEIISLFSTNYSFPSKGLMKKINYQPSQIINFRVSKLYKHDSVVFHNIAYEKNELAEIPITLGSLKIEESIYDQLFKKLNNLTMLHPNKEAMSKFILLKSRILYSISSGMPFKLMNTTFSYSNYERLTINDINIFLEDIRGHNNTESQVMCSPNSNEDLTFLFLIFFTLTDSPNKLISELFLYYPIQVTRNFILNLDFLKFSFHESIVVSYVVKCACLIMLFRLYEGLENLNRNHYCQEEIFITNQFYNYDYDLQEYVLDTIYIGEIMKISYNNSIKQEYVLELMSRNYEVELTVNQVENDVNQVLRKKSPKILIRKRNFLLTRNHIIHFLLINQRNRSHQYVIQKVNINLDPFEDIFKIDDSIVEYLKTRSDENIFLMTKHLTYKYGLCDQYSCVHRLRIDPSISLEKFFTALNEAEIYLLNLFWNCIINHDTYILGPRLYTSIMKNILFNKYNSDTIAVWNPETVSKKYGYQFILD